MYSENTNSYTRHVSRITRLLSAHSSDISNIIQAIKECTEYYALAARELDSLTTSLQNTELSQYDISNNLTTIASVFLSKNTISLILTLQERCLGFLCLIADHIDGLDAQISSISAQLRQSPYKDGNVFSAELPIALKNMITTSAIIRDLLTSFLTEQKFVIELLSTMHHNITVGSATSNAC